MRTTLSIDDDVLAAAREIAAAKHIPLGEAVSDLARRGIVKIGLRTSRSGVLVFDVPDNFPKVTDADVRAAVADFP